jgi:PhoPQ-activated pathogenicity-related protein
MKRYHLDNYINYGDDYCDINWQPYPAEKIFEAINALVNGQVKRILD